MAMQRTRGSGVRSPWVVEEGADATGGFGQSVWLRQETRPNLPGLAGMADRGGEDYVNAGMMVSDPAHETDPIHGARNIDVAEDEIDWCPAREDGNSLGSIGRFDDLVTGTPQKLCHSAADQNLVLYDQDRPLRSCFLV